MNISVYLFGKLTGSYTQYPDDYTHTLLEGYENKIKSPSQLIIHRNNDLMYYTYIRQLSEHGKYIGICSVVNGVIINDLKQLQKIYDENINNWVVNGDILEFNDNGDIISNVDKLYKISSEFKRLSKSLAKQISDNGTIFSKLPPVNFSTSNTEEKQFSNETDNSVIVNATKDYANVFVYSDNASVALAGYASKLRKLNQENIALKEENARVNRLKKRTTIVSVLSIILLIGFILVIVLANRSSEQQRQIDALEKTNAKQEIYIRELQRDSTTLETQLYNTHQSLNYANSHIANLQKDSTNLTKHNQELQNDLYSQKQLTNTYRQESERKQRTIEENNKTITNLQTQLRNAQQTQTVPITISSIQIASTKKNGGIANDFGKYLYSSDSYYIWIKFTGKAASYGSKNITFKLYGPNNYSNQTLYSTHSEYITFYTCESTFSASKVLGKDGNKLPKGNYKVEILYDNKILKSQSFTLY